MKEKFRNTKRDWVFLIFLECVKITSFGLKLNRPSFKTGYYGPEANEDGNPDDGIYVTV